MKLLTKREACRELRISLSTLNRRIAAGDVPVKREPRGRRHRVYVMLDDVLPENGKVADPALAMAQERIRGLEEQVELLQGQLEQERKHNAGPVDELNSPQGWRSSRWRFWQS
ncbi:MAG: hypothetical protein OXI91_01515 [Chloroflexota bacterium]|nr:hypothetical protein [Chloroflexota bacterium]